MNLEIDPNSKERLIKGEILIFEHQPNENVYNPSRPFTIGKEKYILARVENSQTNSSRVYPFVFENNIWRKVEWQLKDIELEDPSVAIIGGNFLLSFVRVLEKTNPNLWIIRTEFYYGPDLHNLNKIAAGPIGMKDIRLVEHEGRIGIFTRPKGGEIYKRGRISYLEIENLSQLEKVDWGTAKLIDLPILDNEWVGTNDVYDLKDGILGVLAHKGSEDEEGNLHYCAVTFKFNPLSMEANDFKIIATRNNFPSGGSKSKKLSDVVFPGGFEFKDRNRALLYCGLNDIQVGICEMPNPFL